MLGVRNRRRLAIALIVIFVALSATTTLVIARYYRPSSLQLRAEAAFRNAFGYTVSLGPATVSLDNKAAFESAKVSSKGHDLLSSGRVRVDGLPRPIGEWQPASVEIASLALRIDLSDKSGCFDSVKALDDIAGRADTSALALPESFAVTVSALDASAEYVAPVKTFLEKRTLELTPGGGAPEADWKFAATKDVVEISAGVGSMKDALLATILREARAGILDAAENAGEGRLTAKWDASGEALTLANPSGWRLPDDAVKAAGLPSPGGATHVTITSLETKDGAVTGIEGHFEFAGEKVNAAEIAKWAALVSLPAPKDSPAEFEGVHAAGEFTLHDGTVSLKPRSGSSALVWSEVKGATTVIISGGASLRRDDLTANAGKMK